jgi:UDP-glucuronate 4-epimerase
LATYLVTGCTGFIGWKVCEFLLADGYPVLGVDNLNDAYDPRLKHWRLRQIEDHPSFTFHRLDICDRESLRSLFEETAVGNPWSAVINLAARAGVRQSLENPWIYFETNVTGVLNLLELCREFGVEKFVQASTSSLYGANNPRPFREEADTDGPLSPYAASKKGAEALCYTYHYLYGLDVSVLRYFTVYGPAGRPDMSLFRFVQWISEGRPVIVYGDGQQSRDYTYVDDIARGTLAALKPMCFDPSTSSGQCEAQQGGYEVINLGSDEPVVINDAIRLVEELVGKKANIEHKPRHPADVLATWADISKAEHLLGWRPQFPFEEGVARLVAWYQENQEWARDVVTI